MLGPVPDTYLLRTINMLTLPFPIWWMCVLFSGIPLRIPTRIVFSIFPFPFILWMGGRDPGKAFLYVNIDVSGSRKFSFFLPRVLLEMEKEMSCLMRLSCADNCVLKK